MKVTGLLCLAAMMGFSTGAHAGGPDTPFVQEYHEPYAIEPGGPGDDVRSVAVDPAGDVWAATKAGLHRLHDGAWSRQAGVTDGPSFEIATDAAGVLWVGSWDGLYRVENGNAEKVAGVNGPVTAVCAAGDRLVALGPDGAWQRTGGTWQEMEAETSRSIRDAAFDPDGSLWVATGMGLFNVGGTETQHIYQEKDIVTGALEDVEFSPDGRLWAAGWGGITIFEDGTTAERLTTSEGLPNFDVRALAFSPDGTVWAGTALGVARYNRDPGFVKANNGSPWSLRHSRRWLLSDDVRDVALGPDGTAWIATAKGVSAIRRRTMTLAQKADHYMAILRQRHVRPPGFVEKCYFPDANDHTKWEGVDDDNDGQYTNIYMVMESFRYAATKDPQAKANADGAFDAMETLQTITGTDGFIARTMVPTDWPKVHDGNETIAPRVAADRRARDPRYKQVETRWRPSADGKWLWKGDTSSDEITGHMYGYLLYYDLAADDAHKDRVRKLVTRVMDYIIDGGYVLRDLDGKHTRWGVWSPEKLKGDPDWRVEAPINAFEILSYLKGAYHITGNPRYQQEYRKLIEEHGYAGLARRPKAYGISERTHIDDELLALAAHALLRYEDDPELKALYRDGYAWSYSTVEHDQNVMFDFTFGMLMGTEGFPLQSDVAFLRDQPLDLRQWVVENSQREDIRLVRKPMQDPLQTDRMLPPSERGVMRWDKNPWVADSSGDFPEAEGRMESSGVFWLLPYWMGRYAGFIEAPE